MEFKVLYEFFIQSYLIVLYRSECPTTTTNNNKGGVTTVKKKIFSRFVITNFLSNQLK